jgi:hypothetical protein
MNLLAARQTEGVFPEVDAAASELVERMGHASVQDRIEKTVRSLAAEARDMESRLNESQADLVPCVVGGASRVQELVIDLLAISRYAQDCDQRAADSDTSQGAQVSGTMLFAMNQSAIDESTDRCGVAPEVLPCSH